MTNDPDNFVFEGLTDVDTYVQRSTVSLGNNYDSYKFNDAIIMECYTCSTEKTIQSTSDSGLNYEA